MANPNPTMTPEFIQRQKPIGLSDTDKVGRKVFGVRLPTYYEQKLDSMPKEDRVILMRTAIMSAIDSYDKEQK